MVAAPMSMSCSKKPEWWLCSLCIVMSVPHTRNDVGTIRLYHFVVTFRYHGFGNSGCSSDTIAVFGTGVWSAWVSLLTRLSRNLSTRGWPACPPRRPFFLL